MAQSLKKLGKSAKWTLNKIRTKIISKNVYHLTRAEAALTVELLSLD